MCARPVAVRAFQHPAHKKIHPNKQGLDVNDALAPVLADERVQSTLRNVRDAVRNVVSNLPEALQNLLPAELREDEREVRVCVSARAPKGFFTLACCVCAVALCAVILSAVALGAVISGCSSCGCYNSGCCCFGCQFVSLGSVIYCDAGNVVANAVAVNTGAVVVQ